MHSKITLLTVLLLIIGGLSAIALSQGLTGDQVLDNVAESVDASSAKIELSMTLYSKSGSTRDRSLNVYMKEQGHTSKAFMRFTAPADVEGTAFLSLDENGSEEMYLYMPVLGSVRKIAGSQKNGSFVGTDFTYNDLSILGGERYSDDYSPDITEHSNGEYVLNLTPENEDIEYTSAKMWVPSDIWFPTKIEFYIDGKLQKVLTNENLEQINNYWTAKKITMKNVVKGTKTVLTLANIEYDIPIEDMIFTTRYMRRQ